MLNTQRKFIFFLFSFLSFPLLAVQPITATIGAEPFDMDTCIQQSIHDCLESVCISPSPADCKTECEKDAENKCQSLAKQGM